MSTLRQVVTHAAQLVAQAFEGQTAPVAYFASEIAVPRFNTMVRALFGHGIGVELVSTRPTTSADVLFGSRYLVGSVALTLTLPDVAEDGDRFAVVDTHAGLATYPVTINRGSWLLEGAASNLTLDDNGLNREWFYRADTANWERIRDLTLDDEVFFPQDIINGLVPMLAQECLPAGYDGSELIAVAAAAGRQRIDHRYAARFSAITDPGLLSGRCGVFNINTGL